MANAIRAWIFRLVFFPGSAVIVLTTPISALFGHEAVLRHAHVWARFHRWTMRWIMGVRVRVEGTVPAGQMLFASKHQGMFETTLLQLVLNGPAIVIKRELAKMPAWGWAARQYGSIPVDREASAGALRQLIRDAGAMRATGRSVLVYPEGTRVMPGETPPLRSGFAGLYKALALPVVPVALDTGLVWPRHGPKRPGIVTIRIGETIPPGLPRAEAEQRVWRAINALEPSAQTGGDGEDR